jgi:hypothetical protein
VQWVNKKLILGMDMMDDCKDWWNKFF